ncbi:MAG: DUF1254 domain-containing protein [Oscillospiraceae bacterium]|nr:DUF1254 domain-containing protein [Oscillospiraceae bacterium]
MKKRLVFRLFALILTLSLLAGCVPGGQELSSAPENSASEPGSDGEAVLTLEEAAFDVYLYFFPLMLCDAIRDYLTNTVHPDADQAPENWFVHYSGPLQKETVGMLRPNGDGLQSVAVLSLEEEPVILQVPEGEKPFYITFFDSWGDPVFTLTEPGRYLLFGTGTETAGYAVAGAKEIYLPDDRLICTALIRCDFADKANKEQAQLWQENLRVFAFSANQDTPPVGEYAEHLRFAPTKVLLQMDIAAYFDRCSALLELLPPKEIPEETKKAMDLLGISAGEKFSLEQFTFSQRVYLQTLSLTVFDDLEQWEAENRREQSGWNWQTANRELDENRQRVLDLLYRTFEPDASVLATAYNSHDLLGKPLTGGDYLVALPVDAIPPGAEFTLSVCDTAGNPLWTSGAPCSISSKDLPVNSEGEYQLLITTIPGKTDSLLVEEGKFMLCFRVYQCPDALLKRLKMPTITKVLPDSPGVEEF